MDCPGTTGLPFDAGDEMTIPAVTAPPDDVLQVAAPAGRMSRGSLIGVGDEGRSGQDVDAGHHRCNGTQLDHGCEGR